MECIINIRVNSRLGFSFCNVPNSKLGRVVLYAMLNSFFETGRLAGSTIQNCATSDSILAFSVGNLLAFLSYLDVLKNSNDYDTSV